MSEPALLFNQLVDAFNRRDWQNARQLAMRLLPGSAQNAVIHYIAGIAHLELRHMPQALSFLHRAVELDATRADYAVQFAKALASVQMSRQARTAADRALALCRDDPALLDTLGVVYTQIHDHDKAAEAFRRAAVLKPEHASYRFNLATAWIAIGDIDDAERELEACIRLDPLYWKAYLALSQTRRQTTSSNHIERLLSLLAANHEDVDAQANLNMALAKEREDLADYASAFGHYVRGKSSAGANRSYSSEQDEALFAAITASFPEPAVPIGGCPTHEPIFVIGMPRTGTTLLERILSSHPDVHSAGELHHFGVALKRASGSLTPTVADLDTIEHARELDWAQLGATYLASTRPATGQTPRFIDKLPHNFLHAGYIARALPNAKIVCLRRDPLDTCLSNFRQLFSARSPYYGYSFNLLDTGRYFVLFDRLMAHWRRVLPGRILEMDYEALVEQQETSSRQLLAWCGLTWHEACLHFEENAAPVNTASAIQVRGPVYRTAVKRWKKYAAQLQPLRDLLIQAGVPITD